MVRVVHSRARPTRTPLSYPRHHIDPLQCAGPGLPTQQVDAPAQEELPQRRSREHPHDQRRRQGVPLRLFAPNPVRKITVQDSIRRGSYRPSSLLGRETRSLGLVADDLGGLPWAVKGLSLAFAISYHGCRGSNYQPDQPLDGKGPEPLQRV